MHKNKKETTAAIEELVDDLALFGEFDSQMCNHLITLAFHKLTMFKTR